jgi:O-antigen/teichoic acid export membrane protein
MSLAFVPAYIKLMGAESFGLVGVFTSLIAMLAVLDLGLSQSMTREMATLSHNKNCFQQLVNTVRTLELIYWLVALGVAATVSLLASFIAYHWLNPETLTENQLLHALWIMAVVIALRWPVAIYTGALNGLQKQILLNKLLIIFSTLQGVGAFAVLWLLQPTIEAFLLWQALIAFAQTVVLRVALIRSLPSDKKGSFSKDTLKHLWRFAAGMTGISIVSTVLTQLDKVLLSKMLTLSEFGYYTFAASVAMVIYKIVGPIFTAYYPRLTELVAKNNQEALINTYHQGCQLMAVTTLPLTLVVAFYSNEILEIWTQNPDVVRNTYSLVSLLILGNALNGLMHIPYALQLAHGWTKLTFYVNVIAVIILVPAIYFATLQWGAVGAASVWILLNTSYLLIGVHLMFRRILGKEKWSWYLNDIAKILLPTLIVLSASRLLTIQDFGIPINIAMLTFIFLLATFSAIFCADSLRKSLSCLKK